MTQSNGDNKFYQYSKEEDEENGNERTNIEEAGSKMKLLYQREKPMVQ